MNCPSFEAFRTIMEAPTIIPTNPGFEVSVHKTLKSINSKISSIFSIRPRTYPVKYYRQSSEQYLPGSFDLNFASISLGFPISFAFSRDNSPIFSTTMPITERTSLDMKATLSLNNPVLNCSTQRITEKTNLNANLLIYNKFNDATLSLSFTTGIPKRFCFGFSCLMSTNEKRNASMIFQIPLPKTKNSFGVILNNIGDKESFNFALTDACYLSDKTCCGASLQIDPVSTNSVFTLGFQRAFLQSSVCACADSKGTIASLYSKRVNDKLTVLVTSLANPAAGAYSFGFGMDINADVDLKKLEEEVENQN